MFSRASTLASRAARPAAARAARPGGAVRRMAGDNVHHRKAPTLFGEQPDTPWEGWEYIVYPTYIAVLLLGMVGVFYKPDTSIHNWARVEALARLRRKAKGEEVLWGVHYANIPTMTYSAESPYSKEAVGELPSKDE